MEQAMKIVVADDDANTRLLLSGSLRKQGWEVVACADGEAAWTAMQAGDIEILITDWEMPVLDGLGLCHRIRKAGPGPGPYILLLTHHGDVETLVSGIDAGADDYLSKPFNPVELRTRLEIGKRRLVASRELHKTIASLTAARTPQLGSESRGAE
jgi:sigma-B regulation protein RsbU (phosphoserine phosphatase)